MKQDAVDSQYKHGSLNVPIHPYKRPRVVTILLNWNNFGLTADCLRSLLESTYHNSEIIVVDNGSQDGSAARLRQGFPSIKLIENSENLGFAAGNNIGIKAAMQLGADYILILNNDTVVAEDMVQELVAACESDPRVGIATPKMLFMDAPSHIWFAGSAVNLWTGHTDHVGFGEEDRGQFDCPLEPGFASGCCFLVRTEVLVRLGGFEERFFIYSEDVDFSLRCRKVGYQIVYVPRAKLWHKESGTMSRERDKRVAKSRQTPKQFYLKTRNLIFVERRHASVFQKLVFAGVFGLRATKWVFERLVEGDWESARNILRGVVHGILWNCGQVESI